MSIVCVVAFFKVVIQQTANTVMIMYFPTQFKMLLLHSAKFIGGELSEYKCFKSNQMFLLPKVQYTRTYWTDF